MNQITTRLVNISDLETVTTLFDAYRQFYSKASDLVGAQNFLSNRITLNESIIFLAFQDEQALGFTQLYPSFSSVSMAKVFVLNDLFVSPAGRGQGVGTALLGTAAAYGKSAGAVRLNLNTDVQNTTAQSVYEAAGWVRDQHYYMYQLDL
jgi:GNAT superfamily N-acetyltransferase